MIGSQLREDPQFVPRNKAQVESLKRLLVTAISQSGFGVALPSRVQHIFFKARCMLS